MSLHSFAKRWPLGLPLTFLVVTAQEAEKPGILRPTDQSVLATGSVQVIARAGGEVSLDGKLIRAQQPAAGRQALSVQVLPGRHELIWKNAGTQQKIQLFVSTPGGLAAPAGWKVYTPHPPQAECQTCHAEEKQEGFKMSTVAETCFTCHQQKTFAAGHAHNDEVFAECVLCHNPHGSAEKFHLKMSRETACKQCHG
ncbi:MAG: hypothetical protein L0387_37945 [Acidobacteria bacterium]|nr:hypothetical protein [Acidobacteriota bacterium]MCI0719515.1 hypothetical protein [Acidobacteriota bacterium]